MNEHEAKKTFLQTCMFRGRRAVKDDTLSIFLVVIKHYRWKANPKNPTYSNIFERIPE